MGLSPWHLFKVGRCCSGNLKILINRRRLTAIEPLSHSLLVTHTKCRGVSFKQKTKQAGLLVANSLMILNRRRFLAKYGLDDLNAMNQHTMNASADPSQQPPLKAQIIGLLHAAQYLKVPVIACNLLVIIFELLLGGS